MFLVRRSLIEYAVSCPPFYLRAQGDVQQSFVLHPGRAPTICLLPILHVSSWTRWQLEFFEMAFLPQFCRAGVWVIEGFLHLVIWLITS